MKLSIQLLAAVFLTLSFELKPLNCVATTTDQQAKQLLSKQNEKGLIENQGQMMDMEGNPVPFVLFKTEAPGVNLWITEQGMTMQTLQIRKEPLTGKDLEEWEAAGGELSGRKKTKKFIDWERIDLTLKGASIKKENIIKEKVMRGHTNYFYPHCPDGIYGVKEYQKVTIQNVYPNIDWVIYRTPEHYFKYDFVVHPGGDYHQIELVYHSKTPVLINKQGQLTFTTNYGDLQENKPVSFYEDKEIATQFIQNYQRPTIFHGDKGFKTSIGFHFPKTSSLKPQSSNLVIDPQLVWGTLYGGNDSDHFLSMDTDNNDNLFITGWTESINFPTQNVGTFFQGVSGGGHDVVILKFNTVGVRLWATHYGGNISEWAFSIATDNMGNVFATGYTNSIVFPTQNAGTFFQGTIGTSSGFYDAFILKFDNAGNRLWATYYGGSGNDIGHSIATDHIGNVFITGSTESTDFPTQNAGTFYQGAFGGVGSSFITGDAFILKFDNAGNRLWATYYGGSEGDLGNALAIDNVGNVFITGETTSFNNFPTKDAGTFYQGTFGGPSDAFILKFDNAGNRLWATHYGGRNGRDGGYSIATDNIGNVFILGYTFSIYFPTYNTGTFYQGTIGGGWDAFILKFDNAGNRLWATYYGGSGYEDMTEFDGIAIDQCNNVYVGFSTQSTNIATLTSGGTNAYNDITYGGGWTDNFIAKFSNKGCLLWTSYIGGNQRDFRNIFTTDSQNNLFTGGTFISYTTSNNLPMFNPGGGAFFDNIPNGNDDPYVLKFVTTPDILPNFTQTQMNSTACFPCNGEATVVIDNNAIPPFSYIWSTGNQTLCTTNNSTTISNLCPGAYWVEINSNCNQIDTLFFDIIGVTASIFFLDTSVCQGDSIIVGTNVYNISGTFLDTLVGAAVNGCDSIVNINLTVNPTTNCESTIIIPNVFSPNGDNHNDLFMIRLVGLEFESLQIYNRWGILSFETKNSNEGWDGQTTAGEIATDGTYFYILNYKDKDEKQIKKGTLTLLR